MASLPHGMRFDSVPKIFVLPNGAYIATAGDGDSRDILEVLGKCNPEELPSKKELSEAKTEFEGILVFPNNQVFAVFVELDYLAGESSQWSSQVVEIYDEIVALGCGLEFAYGVLEAGGTPEDAVKATCKRSLYCGLPAQVVNIPEVTSKKTRIRKKS